MGFPSIPQLAVMLGIVILMVLPIIIVAMSNRVSGKQKVGWVLAVAIVSWLAVIAFFLSTSKPGVEAE